MLPAGTILHHIKKRFESIEGVLANEHVQNTYKMYSFIIYTNISNSSFSIQNINLDIIGS